MVYFLFREPETRLHQWLRIRQTPLPLPEFPGKGFLLYRFADCCWAWALTAALRLLGTLNRFWGATFALLLLSITELEQAGWQAGKLDWSDLIFMSLTVLICNKYLPDEKNH